MKFTIELDSTQDQVILKMIGFCLFAAGDGINTVEELNKRPTEEQDDNQKPAEEKPKHSSRKKSQEEPAPVEQTETQDAPTGQASDLPSEVPSETEPAPANVTSNTTGTATEAAWRKAMQEKVAELGLEKGTDQYRYFLDYIHKLGESYGNRVPSRLSPDKLFAFIQEFNTTAIDTDGSFTSKSPF